MSICAWVSSFRKKSVQIGVLLVNRVSEFFRNLSNRKQWWSVKVGGRKSKHPDLTYANGRTHFVDGG